MIQNKDKYTAELIVDTNVIKLNSSFGNFIKHGPLYFFMLKEIRLELEKINAFILINGSRIDVYPSGMGLTSIRAYATVIGKQARLEDLVNIFDDCLDLSLIATVAEQEARHNEWVASLQKRSDG